MAAIRRVYLYLVSAVSLGMLANGLVSIGGILLTTLTGDSLGGESLRRDIAFGIALTLIGFPVWLFHNWWGRRLFHQDPTEQTSSLRHFYFYLVLFVFAVVGGFALAGLIEELLRWMLRVPTAWSEIVDPLPRVLVSAMFWWYHWTSVENDRLASPEVGKPATIRRWYVYLLSFWFLIVFLNGLSDVIRIIWQVATGSRFVDVSADVSTGSAAAIAGLLLWRFHWLWSTVGPVAADDRRSTLRTVYLLFVIGISTAVTLFQASQLLFYTLSRLLGVSEPAGRSGSLLTLLAGPLSLGLTYGVTWYVHQRILRDEGREEERTPHQIGVRRFSHYLVTLVAAGLLSVGVGGVLWIFGDLLMSAVNVSETWWRERLSLYATMAIVGLPVWLVQWRAVVPADEAGSLPRRLYVYIAAMAAVLACLGAGATALYQLLNLLLGTQTGRAAAIDLVRAGAVFLTGLGLGVYHWRALRSDSRIVAAAPPPVDEGRNSAVLLLQDSHGHTLRRIEGDRETLTKLFEGAEDLARSGPRPG